MSTSGVKTARIVELMHIYETRGFWNDAEAREAREIVEMGRDAGYVPEGTEDWMQEDGVPRAYDKPRRVALRDLPAGTQLDVSLDRQHLPPIDVPKELRELAERGRELREQGEGMRGKHVHYDAATDTLTPVPEVDNARIKTLEATVTDMMRRLKALEGRVIDPSV